MLTILIFIVCVCNLHASEHDILGQSPRSAEIFRKKVNPFLYMGFGGMISREFGLFGSRGFGINSQISKDIQFEIHYKEIRGDMFVFSQDNPMQLSMKQKGIQTSVYIIL